MKTMTHAEFNAMLSRLARDAMEDAIEAGRKEIGDE